MSILIIGAGDAATESARALQADRVAVRHYRDAASALSLLRRQSDFSLVMAEQGDEEIDSLRRELTAIQPHTPLVVIGRPDQPEAAAGGPAMCSIERTSDGCQRLRCALNEAHGQPSAHPDLADMLDRRPVAFAYSSPCDRRR